MNVIKSWVASATKEEKDELVTRVDTSMAYVYQLSGGFRSASPDLAKRIEDVTKDMNARSDGRLPVIYRTDSCAACRDCEFARLALGPIAARSDFDLID